jgi:1,2-dihydroxy-3-keto-5-methylthiopentene dioxygenase
MATLHIFPENDPGTAERVTDPEQIAEVLAGHGVRYGTHPAADAAAHPAAGDVLEAHRPLVNRLCEEGGYRFVDVARLHPDPGDPDWTGKAGAARRKFLTEHRHEEDEVRFFTAGHGCFYLRLGGRVYAVVCERGDLLSVPAGVRHWFDMGSVPDFCAIRFFREEDGWVGDFTGDPLGERIPTLDELLEAAVV